MTAPPDSIAVGAHVYRLDMSDDAHQALIEDGAPWRLASGPTP